MRLLTIAILSTILVYSCQNESKNADEDKSYNLSFHPEKGLKKEMGYEFKIESPSNKSTLDYNIDFTFEVIESNEKETTTKITYQDIRFDGNIDTLNFSLKASDKDSSSPVLIYAEPYFICLNHIFSVKYSPTMQKISEELLTEKDLKSLTEPSNKAQLFTALPDKEVKIGDTWKNKVELKSGKGMTVTAIYRLDEVKENVAFISFEGDLDGKGEGFGHDFSMKGKVSGSLEVELSSGLTLNSEMTQDLILMLSEKETPMKFTIKQYIK